MVFNLSGFGSLQHAFKDEFGKWIPFDDFYILLRGNHLHTEKPLKKSQILYFFKRDESNCKIVDDKLHVNSTAILKCIFHFCHQISFCTELVSEIESKLIKEESTVTQKSIKDLYSKIATNLTYSCLDGFILHKLNTGANSTILSLYAQYENDFNSADWKKICVFEYHYSQHNYKSGIIPSYETDLDNKYSYYSELHHAVALSKNLKSLNTAVIHERTQRIQASLLNESICFTINDQKHNTAVLDKDLTDLIGDVAEWIICVDCVSSCQHPPSIHVYIELKSAENVDFNDIVYNTKAFLSKYHNLGCYNIIFFSPEAMQPYLSKEATILRFILRDDVMMKKLYDYKCYEYCEDGVVVVLNSVVNNISYCTQCFGSLKKNPLNWKSFSWLEEWSLQTPLIVQIIFGSFLSDKSVKASDNVETLLQKKVNKLYSMYDMLLNTRNKKYMGIFQLKNSHELSMNYQSLQTVFNVSSGAGSACSLSTAERKLKQEASSDMCYYNTYLKKYPLMYETSEGMATHYINLRSSLLVFMMDNLVRLKYHADPCPGENRSMQMCTLPKTLK